MIDITVAIMSLFFGGICALALIGWKEQESLREKIDKLRDQHGDMLELLYKAQQHLLASGYAGGWYTDYEKLVKGIKEEA